MTRGIGTSIQRSRLRSRHSARLRSAAANSPEGIAKGDQVKSMQTLLLAKGSIIEVDGEFGPKTETEVKKFQAAHGLVSDGICGPMSWAALK
jgi:peptidoglycan hydrolase-like protein with peptidoglycan-binding domain